MRFREWLLSLGWLYFAMSCLGSLIFIVKIFQTSTEGARIFYFGVGVGFLLQGSMILTIIYAIGKIMEKQNIIFEYLKNNLLKQTETGIKTVIIEHNRAGGSGKISTN